MTLTLPQISGGYLISPLPLTIMHLEQMCQSNWAKCSNRGGFCVWTAEGGNTGAQCPRGLLNNTQALQAGSYYWLEDIKKNAPLRAHTYSTHTHTAVDKIYQVSGTTLREGVELWNTHLIKSSFSMTHTSGCGFKRIPACVLWEKRATNTRAEIRTSPSKPLVSPAS